MPDLLAKLLVLIVAGLSGWLQARKTRLAASPDLSTQHKQLLIAWGGIATATMAFNMVPFMHGLWIDAVMMQNQEFLDESGRLVTRQAPLGLWQLGLLLELKFATDWLWHRLRTTISHLNDSPAGRKRLLGVFPRLVGEFALFMVSAWLIGLLFGWLIPGGQSVNDMTFAGPMLLALLELLLAWAALSLAGKRYLQQFERQPINDD